MKKIAFALALGLCALSARPAETGWDAETLAQKARIISPALGASLEFVKSEKAGLIAVVVNYQGPALPPKKGVVLELEPPAASAIFVSHIKFRNRKFDPYWTEPQWPDSFGEISRFSNFIIWQEKPGRWGVMISLVGGGMQTWLEGGNGKLIASAESWADNFAPSRSPMFAFGFGEDPYQLTREIYAFGLETMKRLDPEGVRGNLRTAKKFPELFNYVGWCSWNAYYQEVDEDKLIASAKSFRDAGFPLRWVLIDDRWMPVTRKPGVANNGRTLALTGFEADPAKFPNGLGHTISILKKDYGLDRVGVWLTFQGYWNGVALDSEIGRNLPDSLMKVSDEVGIPDPRSSAGRKFWDGWFGFLSRAGVDFVKVDNQGDHESYAHGALPVTTLMANSQNNLETAAEKYFKLNLLNCMSQNLDAIYQWQKTNLARASIDTWPKIKKDPRDHAVDTVANALWLSNLVYPDYDMWFTNAAHSDYHAVGRAISGGPVYVTDRPENQSLELLWPLIFSDGTIIRVEDPGLPARISLVNDPYRNRVPLVAFAKSNGAGMLAAWNVDNKMRPVSAELSPADVEGLQGRQFAVYDYFAGTVSMLSRSGKFPVRLGKWEVKLFSIVPIENGFAAIGLANKYISPATIGEQKFEPGRALISLAESGPFAAYCAQKPAMIKAFGKPIETSSYANNLLKLDLPKGSGPVELEIIF